MALVIINEESIEQKHICWFTKRESFRIIKLYEVKECYYRHPEAKDYAIIKSIEVFFIDECNALEEKAASWVLMEANQKAIKV